MKIDLPEKMKTQRKILIVDDNQINVSILTEILEEYQLKSVNDGISALKVMEEYQPDLVLLDIMMPDLNGYEVCQKIRQNPSMHQSKIIMVSAKTLLSERIKGYEVGADDYVTKPFDDGEMLAKIKVYMRLISEEEVNIIIRKKADELAKLSSNLKNKNDQLQHEISKRLDAEKKLEGERASLKHKVEEQTIDLRESLDALEHTNKELIKANEHKNRFISTMNHELRTPLNAILGFSDLLFGEFYGKLNHEQMDYCKRISLAGKDLLDLINDILEISKIDAGVITLVKENIDINRLFQNTLMFVRTQAHKKNIRINPQIDCGRSLVIGDLLRCKQILLNLLTNAIKYSSPGADIIVKAVRFDSKTIRIEIIDTGIGIELAQQKDIFKEFYQVDEKRDEKLGGVGIGLALVQRLVNLHNGSIGVKSDLGQGSTFWVNLPSLDSGKTSEIKREKPLTIYNVDSRKGKKILVVEDEDANLTLILDMLAIQNHTVKIAINGKDAIEAAKSFKPEIILMDLYMPVMDGFETTKMLREMTTFAKTPIIALTASNDNVTMERCISAGCTDWLAKPIRLSKLFKKLNRYLGTE